MNHDEPGRAPAPDAEACGGTGAGDAELPQLLDLELSELRTVEHPVLDEVLAGLRERVAEPTEMLWGFNSAF
jgi:FXSXX-COOH protein